MTDARTWTVRGGAAYGVFGEHVVAVLPASARSRAAAVWELVDDGAGFDEVLDAILAAGLRSLADLVLLGRDQDTTRILLRGAARADLATADEVVHLQADPATTWVERVLDGVVRVRLEIDAGAHEEDQVEVTVTAGLVPLSTAECPPVVAAPQVPLAEPVSIPEPSAPDPAPDADAYDPELTAAMPAIAPAGGPWLDVDHDGRTRAGDPDHARHAAPAPGIAGQPSVPPVVPRPVARLVFSSGQDVLVDRAVLVGRAPESRGDAQAEPPLLVAVPSPHQEISSTHLEIRPGAGADHGSAVVTDLGSTNGTLLVQPGLPPEDLQAGIAVQLIPGAVVDLGDGVTIQVASP